jgi:hypothetical protein
MSQFDPAGDPIDGHALTCRELVSLVTEYLDDALPADERALFEAHLEICLGCRNHLEQIRVTVETTGRLRERDLPADFRDRMLTAFRTWSRASHSN